MGDLPANSALLDGEVVVMRPDGGSDFVLLLGALSANDQAAMRFVAFDLLHAEGHDLRGVPLTGRKQALKALLDASPASVRAAVQYSDHVVGHGPLLYDQTARLGLEGVVSKAADAPYRSGRSDRWRKSKHLTRQEFVIAGYTDLEGGGKGMGALLLAGWDDGVLRPVGKVGTGFSDAQRVEFQRALATVARAEPAVSFRPDDPDDLAGCTGWSRSSSRRSRSRGGRATSGSATPCSWGCGRTATRRRSPGGPRCAPWTCPSPASVGGGPCRASRSRPPSASCGPTSA